MEYDRFQREAIEHIKNNHSLMVAAPTGAGKTVIAEYVIEMCLANNTGVVYTAPIKALSNQKFRDFRQRYPDRIGILTGDVSINPQAPVLIMTTEIFRNKLLDKDSDIGRFSWVIFDEIHYLDDPERGVVWEESIIFLKEHINILALSATIPNIDQVTRWIRAVHQRPVQIVTEDVRPVPLHLFYHCNNAWYDDLRTVRHTYYKKVSPHRYRRNDNRHSRFKPNRLDTLMRHLVDADQLPCIYFCFSRIRCEHLAEELDAFQFLSPEENTRITALYDELCARYELSAHPSAGSLRRLIERGIGYHHAGMLPSMKEVVECLFTSRLLKVIFTTETFALGINMPARTVIFDELRKFLGTRFGFLKTRDFYQMAGRAGRRGIDPEGFVYTRLNPTEVPYAELERIVHGASEPVKSQFNSSYATVLHLYQTYRDKLDTVYLRSLHHFQEKHQGHQAALRLLKAKVQLLASLGYIHEGTVTPKGLFAATLFGFELPLTELYDQGYLERLDVTDLGLICLALVFEPRKRDQTAPLSHRARILKKVTDGIERTIRKGEQQFRVYPSSKRFYYQLSPCLEGWIAEQPFTKIITYTNIDEGTIVRYFRMVIQVLRQMLDAHPPETLRRNIHTALSRINRDVIDAEHQLSLSA